MDARDRNHLLEQLRRQDETIARQHRENRQLREMITELKKENAETQTALVQTCKQLHDTRKDLLPGF